MAIQAGLVGLPNVGKSTLFNALTKSEVPAENFPFCTIEPHVAITAVPDARLSRLATIFDSKKIIPATMQFVDIAGLVSGASKGEGLGNKFLSHVMEVDLIIHVLRCFSDDDISHVSNNVDPIDDFSTISAELMLKDLESLEKRTPKVLTSIKKTQGSPKERKVFEAELEFIKKATAALDAGNIDEVKKIAEEAKENGLHNIHLLSAKPFLVAANLSEDDFSSNSFVGNEHFKALVAKFGRDRVIPVSAKIEAELSVLPEEDATMMREELSLDTCGLSEVIRETYKELGLITFFTCGPKEAHAWSTKKGSTAPEAAGEIHSDLQRGFICAETYNAQDIFDAGSEKGLKESGKVRKEGKEYIIQDGDLINVLFNV